MSCYSAIVPEIKQLYCHYTTDLRVLYEYIAFILLEPETAAKQLERVEKAILSLDEMPERFPVFDKEPWYSRGIRKLFVNNFIVLYIAEFRYGIVTIIRIMYGGRDIDEQLKKTIQ
jgi:toxin ParE1/3/4